MKHDIFARICVLSDCQLWQTLHLCCRWWTFSQNIYKNILWCTSINRKCMLGWMQSGQRPSLWSTLGLWGPWRIDLGISAYSRRSPLPRGYYAHAPRSIAVDNLPEEFTKPLWQVANTQCTIIVLSFPRRFLAVRIPFRVYPMGEVASPYLFLGRSRVCVGRTNIRIRT